MEMCRNSEFREGRVRTGLERLKMFLNYIRQKQNFILGNLWIDKKQVNVKLSSWVHILKSAEGGH